MFINSLKFLLRFSDTSIYEEVSQTHVVPLGTNLTPIVSSGGYEMQDDQYLFGDGVNSNGYISSITDEYTIGFWLYPINTGVIVDSSTGNLLSVEMPVLIFTSSDSAEGTVVEITEHTQISGNNSLKISEEDYSAFSEEYEPNKWHHFLITRNLSGLQIFVDGKEHTLQSESGSISTLANNGLNVYVNHNLDGYAVDIAKNTGVIDDIFLLNVRNNSLVDIQRIINDGLHYVVDDVFTGSNIVKSDIYMNDSETITINSMIDDLSYIFIGRNDGKIMRGSALFWETRRSFSDSEEYRSGGLPESLDFSGFLKLNNSTIRL